METIDLTIYHNKLLNVWDERLKSKSHIAFKLKERVPLGALNFTWMMATHHSYNNEDKILKNYEDKYPVGINYNFSSNGRIYPYKFSFGSGDITSKNLLRKTNAAMSYVTMPFLHENGLLNVQNTISNNSYGVFINENGLGAFVEIPYDVYITALHIFNATNSQTDIDTLKDHPYLTTDDVSKLQIPIEDVRVVQQEDVYLPSSFFGGVFGALSMEIVKVDDIYEYLTGSKLEQQPFKLFEYE